MRTSSEIQHQPVRNNCLSPQRPYPNRDSPPNNIPHREPRTRDRTGQVPQQPGRWQKELMWVFAQAYRLVHRDGQAIRPHAQPAPVLDSPEERLEPLRGPRDREGENDAVPPDEGDPVSQQGLEGLGQLCFLGRRKETHAVLFSNRQRRRQDPRWHHGGWNWRLLFLSSLLQGQETPPIPRVTSPWRGLN